VKLIYPVLTCPFYTLASVFATQYWKSENVIIILIMLFHKYTYKRPPFACLCPTPRSPLQEGPIWSPVPAVLLPRTSPGHREATSAGRGDGSTMQSPPQVAAHFTEKKKWCDGVQTVTALSLLFIFCITFT
jgi:hypothetical protein